MRTLKILGFLLTYADADHVQAIDQCINILTSEKWLSAATLQKLFQASEIFKKRLSLLDLVAEPESRTP